MFEILTGTPAELRGIEQFLILLSLILRIITIYRFHIAISVTR